MRLARLFAALVGIGICAGAACSWTAPSDEELSGGLAASNSPPDASTDSGQDATPTDGLTCEAGGKLCDGTCVSIDDPTFGCSPLTCTGCQLDHATPTCVDGRCAVGACEGTWQDCDGIDRTGCESDQMSDPNHCQQCGHACLAPPNMHAPCVSGVCGDPACDPGYQDCDPDADGCETHTDSDIANCRECGRVCPGGPGGSPECVGGDCGLACNEGLAECNEDLVDGCEQDIFTDPLHCGNCRIPCSLPHVDAYVCERGHCGVGACATLWGDCNQVASDGCEQDLSSVKQHCGECFRQCEGGLRCVQGDCV